MNKGKLYRRINLCTTCIFGFSILLLAACIIIAIANRGDPSAAHLFGVKPIYVSSNAMEPTIGQNSIVLSRKAALDELAVGDIVMRLDNDRLVIRRIVKITVGGDLITRADNRFFEDATALDDSNFVSVIVFR
jgi:Peptidase S24-like.